MRRDLTKASKARAKPKSGLDLLRIPMFGRELPLYWTWILLGVFAVLTHLMIRLQIKEMTFEFLEVFAEDGEGTFRNAGYSFGGEIEATELEIVPYDHEAGERPIRVGRVVVETPGLFWLLRTSMPSFSPKAGGTLGKLQRAAEKFSDEEEQVNEFAPATRMTVRFEDVDWGDYGLGWMVPQVDWVGAYSGALFEAAGCERDWWWSQDEVRTRFGAPNALGTIAMDFTVDGPKTLKQKIVFSSEATSSLTIERDWTLLGEAEDFLDSDPDTWRTTRVRWTVDDKGFVRARNAWCAKEAKIPEADFVERHIAAVRRLVLANGFAPDAAVWATYRGYAERGGRLVWETRLAPGKALEDADGHGPDEYLIAMNARLSVEGRSPAAYLGTFGTPMELPLDEDTQSLVQVLRKEGTLPAPGAAATPTALPAMTGAAQAPAATPEPVASVARRPVALPANAEVLDAYADEPEPEAPARLTARDLAGQVGRNVRVTLANGRRYAGYVQSADASGVSLKVAVTSGSATLTFTRANISSIEALGASR